MKLYYAAHTRATRPRWLLEELGIEHEVVHLDLSAGEQKTEAYKKIHPLGKVPALIDGEVVIFESSAICSYLADKHGRFAPPLEDPRRGEYLQWMSFATASLEVPVAELWIATRYTAKETPERAKKEADEARTKFAKYAEMLDAHLSGDKNDKLSQKQYLLGDEFTAADVVNGSILVWARSMGMIDAYPMLLAYTSRVHSRPAAVRTRLPS